MTEIDNLNELAGLPEEIKTNEEEFKFIEPITIKFKIKHKDFITEHQTKLDKIQVVQYREANYGDDKIMIKSRIEYIFKTNKLSGKVIK